MLFSITNISCTSFTVTWTPLHCSNQQMDFTENNSAALSLILNISKFYNMKWYVPCHGWLDFVDLFCVGYMLVIVEMYVIDQYYI